jgi:hypothetical protein
MNGSVKSKLEPLMIVAGELMHIQDRVMRLQVP